LIASRRTAEITDHEPLDIKHACCSNCTSMSADGGPRRSKRSPAELE